ncbi:MAG: hypothetical protein RIU67_473, partial [Actinomycetota bacterium]
MTRSDRLTILFPGTPCNALMRHGDPCVVNVTIR